MRLVTSLSQLRMTHLMVILALLFMALPTATPVSAVSNSVVISQVYGGGGNAGAPYQNDFVELHNISQSDVSLSGMSIQYASATGTGNFGASNTQLVSLSGTLTPGQYYLVQLASNAAVGALLPTADVSGTIAMSGTAGKVALVNGTTTLGCNGSSTPCTAEQLARIVDLVGFGTANFYETSPAPGLNNTTSAIRAGTGCTDTDNNSVDFTTITPPTPRNSASALNVCAVVTKPTLSINSVSANEGGTGATTDFTFTVSLSAAAGAGGVTFDIATADGTATVADNDYAANTLTGVSIPEGSSTSDPFTVVVNGDATYEPDETFTVNVTNINGAANNSAQGVGTIINDEPVCDLPFTHTYEIQGIGTSAAITGTVTTQGVVVGDFEGRAAASGFYLQDATGDGDPATSDGIFVYTGSGNTVSLGQLVRVTGFARERFNQTTINGSDGDSAAVAASSIVSCGTGSVAPTDVEMPFASADAPEQYEGMLVRLPQTLVISEYFNYDRFGEIVLGLPLDGEPRPFTSTSIDEPGPAAQARALANSLRRITLDDVQSAQNPPLLRHPNGDLFSLSNYFRGGDTVKNTVGILGYDFNLYRIFPTGPAEYAAVNPRPTAPEPVSGRLRVSAMNTLNFFITPDYASGNLDNKCGPLNNVECRGWDADQTTELTRQRDKLLAALVGVDADVVGLNELENSTGVDPLGDPTYGLVTGLNQKLGAGTYAAIDTGVIGTDAIKVGMIYKPGRVTPVGDYKLLNSTVDPRFIDTRNRPSLAQTFEEVATGARFTVVVNHFKSKGSACDGDPDTGDGQGNCNLTRTAAAQALVDWLATDPTGSGDADYLIMGDLNSYAKEDPIDAILAGADDAAGTGDDYTNLIHKYQGDFAYSYVFDGQAGYLDQALASASLTAQVTRAADWHINSDEADVLDYDTSFKPNAQDALYQPAAYRTSDHDPVVVGLKLNVPTVSTPVVTPEPSIEGAVVTASANFSSTYAGYDPFTCTVDYGDGSGVQAGVVNNMTCIGPEHTYSTYGKYTVTVTVTDKEGAWGTNSTVHTVIFDFYGFYGSVENPPAVNTVNSGKAVPLSFTLGGDKGLKIFSTPPTVTDCQTGKVSAASGSLIYDPLEQNYTFTWKTSKTWPTGTCRQFNMTLVDGTTHQANFTFVK